MGSKPTAALALVVFLTAFRFAGEKIKEAVMSKKHRKSKSKACVVKRQKSNLVSIINHTFETLWAVGASAAAAIGVSTSIH